MSIAPDMETFLDQAIDHICDNDFVDPELNHCAHFVSHALGFRFAKNCSELGSGHGTPANVRVHEIFARCPHVGRWEDRDATVPQLVFVTRRNAVNLAQKRMDNIPEKHIGVYQNGFVYHYANNDDKVIKQTVDDFFARYQAQYAGDQALFFGEFPPAAPSLTS
jgi:hypothetical protein